MCSATLRRWLREHSAHRPIVVPFYAVGSYEVRIDGLR
jgi:hypothetical protein